MKAVPAKGVDIKVTLIRVSHRGWAVVYFEDIAPVVVVKREESSFGGVSTLRPSLGVRKISEGYLVPTPAIGL